MPINRVAVVKRKSMNANNFTIIAVLFALAAGVAAPVRAQVEKYDSNSGKYVTPDPLNQVVPSDPSPYRLNPSLSKRTTSSSGAALNNVRSSSGQEASALGRITPTSQPSAASPVPTIDSSEVTTDQAAPFTPMPGMAIFDPSGVSIDDPFAKPDWWPK